MSDTRVEEFPLLNLAFIFQPPGLPLVDKGSEVGTTSVLVRGGAGSGKTTMAVAIAHSIAAKNFGVCLYLSTEFVPTELKYKAQLLKLADNLVLHSDARLTAKPGSLISHSLVRYTKEAPPETMAERKQSAIDVLWELVRSDPTDASTPIRAVVIDSFGLSEDDQRDPKLRTSLLELIQALEFKGISSIIIQEAGPVDWLSFIVDVVFETSYQIDPDTKDLHRKLTCPKSRYATTLAGPHDMGLDFGCPAIWPDPLPVVLSSDKLRLPPSQVASFLISTNNGEEFIVLQGGALLSFYDQEGGSLTGVLQNVPGGQYVFVDCGPLTIIDANESILHVPDSDGAFSIGWAVLRLAFEGGVNSMILQGLDSLLERPRFHIAMLHVIEAWRLVGIAVCIHGQSTRLEPMEALADFVAGRKISRARPFPEPWPGAVSWLLSRASLPASAPTDQQDIVRAQQWNPTIQRLLQQIEQGELEAADASAKDFLTVPLAYYEGADSIRVLLEWCIAGTRLGLRQNPAKAWKGFGQLLAHLRFTGVLGDPEMLAVVAWSLAHMGQDGLASKLVFDAFSAPKQHSKTLLLWHALCAVYAENRQGLETLKKQIGTPNEKLVLSFLMRALARQKRWEEIDKLADDLGTRHHQPLWMIRRIKAEARIASKQEEHWQEAANELTEILKEDLPRIHRAEVLCNLGLVYNLLEKEEESQEILRKAIEVNPFLEAATNAIL